MTRYSLINKQKNTRELGSMVKKAVYFTDVQLSGIDSVQCMLVEPIEKEITKLQAGHHKADDVIIIVPPRGMYGNMVSQQDAGNFRVTQGAEYSGEVQGPTLQFWVDIGAWVQQKSSSVITNSRRITTYHYTQYEGGNALDIIVGPNVDDFPIPEYCEHEQFTAIKYFKYTAHVQSREELSKLNNASSLVVIQQRFGTEAYHMN